MTKEMKTIPWVWFEDIIFGTCNHGMVSNRWIWWKSSMGGHGRYWQRSGKWRTCGGVGMISEMGILDGGDIGRVVFMEEMGTYPPQTQHDERRIRHVETHISTMCLRITNKHTSVRTRFLFISDRSQRKHWQPDTHNLEILGGWLKNISNDDFMERSIFGRRLWCKYFWKWQKVNM